MNAKRRKDMTKVLGLISEVRTFLDEISQDEREAVDNMPDAFKDTEQGERREEIAIMLEESLDTLEELENNLEECTS